MSDDTLNKPHATEDDLLANAIPIDAGELEEAEEIEALDEAEDELAPIELDAAEPAEAPKRKIQALGFQKGKHEEKWSRSPNVTGQGAIHVKTFVAKLRLDAIEHLDEQVNHWLDAHPQYEVKFVTTTVGDLKGKLTEQALFMSVWV